MTMASMLVDATLSNPPADNADLLAGAVALDAYAARLAAEAHLARSQARRLRDFAAARQARMDGNRDNPTSSPAASRG